MASTEPNENKVFELETYQAAAYLIQRYEMEVKKARTAQCMHSENRKRNIRLVIALTTLLILIHYTCYYVPGRPLTKRMYGCCQKVVNMLILTVLYVKYVSYFTFLKSGTPLAIYKVQALQKTRAQ